VTPTARRELEQAFLRVLRVREPGNVWRVLTPNEAETFFYRSAFAGPGGRSDNGSVEDGGE
jgi:hypothetical protein